MMMNNYDFNLNPYSLRQESTINSILESRLVPRDLSNLDDYVGDDEKSYLYIDNNGKSSKIKLSEITSKLIKIEKRLPSKVTDGQLVLVNNNQGWKLYYGIDGNWANCELEVNSDLVDVDLPEYKSKYLNGALQEISDKFDNTVSSIKGLSGEVDILTDRNLNISEEENNLIISAPNMATKDELESQKEFLKSYINNSEISCKSYTDSSIVSLRDDLEEMIYSPITTVEILPEDWEGSEFPYSVNKYISGVNINNRSKPSFDLNLSSRLLSYGDILNMQDAWSKVYYKAVGSNSILLKSTEKPTVKLTIDIRGF